MKRLAVFVEGYSELVFVSKLLEEVAGAKQVTIEQKQLRGGKSVPRRSITIRAADPNSGASFYVLIVDCGGDAAVKTRIIEEHANLSQVGYELIIGLRDVRPDFTREEIPRLQVGLQRGVRADLVPVHFHLAVMELEAWLLAEVSHLEKVDAQLTREAVSIILGYDPQKIDTESLLAPAADLGECYASVGRVYRKGDAVAIMEALDFAALYIEHAERLTFFKHLTTTLDRFLTSPRG